MSWGVVLACALVLGWVPIFVFRPESQRESLPMYTKRERLWVRLAPCVVGTHMTAAYVSITLAAAIPLWSAILGLLVEVVAVAFWFWGRVLIGPLRMRRLPNEPPLRLRRDGAFGIVRHPLYVAYLLAAAAPLVIVPRCFLGVTFALCVLVLAVRAVQEERWLHAQLGTEYAVYCRSVKRLVPFVW
jgi:protein-S-isoprenylcysteine O-methyltransferase Ste14